MIRHIARPLMRGQAAFSTAAVPANQTNTNEEKTRRWLQRINQLTTSPSAKSLLGQLTTVVNLLNRKALDVPKVWMWSDAGNRLEVLGG